MSVSVAEVVREGLCIGCGVCRLACPFNAIEIVFSETQGSYHPTIIRDRCTNCGLCLKVCFGASIDYELNFSEDIYHFVTSTLGKWIKCYLGFATDQNSRFRASSGGVVTALLNFLLDEKYIDGAIVTKILPGNPPMAKSFVARNKDELNAAMGSKYCPVLLNSALRQIESGKSYALVGLPCHVYAVKKLAETNKLIKGSIKFYIGLFCGGTPSYNGTIYLLRKYGRKNQYIKKMEYRGGGWPGRMVVQTDSSVLTIPFTEYWPIISPWFHLKRCIACFSGFNNQADISCGDAWLPEIVSRDMKGSSIIISRTKIGNNILYMAKKKGYIEIQPININLVLKAQKSMLEFKHFRLGPRLKILKLFRKKVYMLRKLDISRSAKWTAYLDELLLLIGRFLASRKNLWTMFDLYIIVLKHIHSLLNRLKNII